MLRPITRAISRAVTTSVTGWPGASAFNPLSLFSNGEQGAWYDPSDLATLFQDAAGTTPVTADGDPVGLMLDKSGNGNHASQSVAASRPIYRTDGVLHWLESDGVDDQLVTGKALSLGSNIIVAAAAEKLSDSVVGTLLSGNSLFTNTQPPDNFALRLPRSSTALGALFGTVSGGFPLIYEDVAIAAPRKVILLGGKVDSVSRLYVNSALVASTPSVNTAFVTPALYVLGHNQGRFHGRLFGMILRSGDFSPQDQISQYLAAKAGVQL